MVCTCGSGSVSGGSRVLLVEETHLWEVVVKFLVSVKSFVERRGGEAGK